MVAMRVYARIEKGIVAEILEIDGEIDGRFHSSLLWVEITTLSPRPGQLWRYQGGKFLPPAPPAPLPLHRTVGPSDSEMGRIAEDLIIALLKKQLIGLDDLPAEAVAKINQRRQLRGQEPL